MTIAFRVKNNDEVTLNAFLRDDTTDSAFYDLKDKNRNNWMSLKLINNNFEIIEQSKEIIEDSEIIEAKLAELLIDVIEQNLSGADGTDTEESAIDPYNPDSIKVQTKPFSIKLIYDMIDEGDVDLNPDFQRNFVWSRRQKSRLIESILLRIPLPMFYFSEDDEGLITVVDGLQRLTTIKEFMDNKFPLQGLEYLKDSSENCYYSNKNKNGSPNNLKALEAKYFRWFNMTQLTVNVIDPSSPAKVKYDIFRRINTGGKTLNNQEIRNCLSSASLRAILKKMTVSNAFLLATDNSIKSNRMVDQEVALRFISFYEYYKEDSTLNIYNGNMEATLDETVERLSQKSEEEMSIYINKFSNAMQNAHHLFGKYTFRKILPKHLVPKSRKQLINKALFVSWAVLLSQYDPIKIKSNNKSNQLVQPLANILESDRDLYNYLSYGTNGKVNLQSAFTAAKELISKHLKY